MTGPSSREDDADRRVERARRLVLAFLPVIIFAGLVVLLLFRLFAGDASRLPSALIGSKVPSFNLAAVEGLANKPGLSDADLRQGHVTLVNVFASWCVPCHQEHAILDLIAKDAKLAAEGVSLVAIAYKDEPANTRRFLAQEGDPYGKIGADRSGMTGIDFGVYGVPETFIVKGDGTIAYKFIGPMNEDSLRDTVLPEIEKARQ
jgi:cytochrome c biogenesis protein CcmG/thiol:disulfide interchange protein DsbE